MQRYIGYLFVVVLVKLHLFLLLKLIKKFIVTLQIIYGAVMDAKLFNFRLSEDRKKKLLKLAEKDHRTMSNMLCKLIDIAYENLPAEEKECPKVG